MYLEISPINLLPRFKKLLIVGYDIKKDVQIDWKVNVSNEKKGSDVLPFDQNWELLKKTKVYLLFLELNLTMHMHHAH